MFDGLHLKRPTTKVIQGHCRCCNLIDNIRFLLVFTCKYISILHRFRDINPFTADPVKALRFAILV